jgi:hypothetical protein
MQPVLFRRAARDQNQVTVHWWYMLVFTVKLHTYQATILTTNHLHVHALSMVTQLSRFPLCNTSQHSDTQSGTIRRTWIDHAYPRTFGYARESP